MNCGDFVETKKVLDKPLVHVVKFCGHTRFEDCSNPGFKDCGENVEIVWR